MKRVKRRYLALQFDCERLPSEREFIGAVWSAVTKMYGEVGASLTGLSLINFNAEEKIFVIRCSLVSLPSVKASIASITCMTGQPVAIRVLAVSGTLKALFSSLK